MAKVIPKIAVAIKKGGQGKTTVTRGLAEHFGIRRRKGVALLDLDAQCNLSTSYLETENTRDVGTRPPIHPDYDPANPDPFLVAGRSSTAEIFYSGQIKLYDITKVSGMETVQILPADEQKLAQVARADRLSATLKGEEKRQFKTSLENRLKEFFESAEEDLAKQFELILMDLPYAENILTSVALRACTHLLIPFDCEPLGVDGMYKMLGMWRQENKRRSRADRVKILAIQPNRYKARRASQEELLKAMEDEQQSGLVAQFMSKIRIPDLNEFSQIYQPKARPQSVFHLSRHSKARQVAERFGDHMEERLFGDKSALTETEQTELDKQLESVVPTEILESSEEPSAAVNG